MEDYFNLLPVKSTVGWWETSQPQLHSFTLETSTSPALSCAGRWKGVLWSVHDSCSLPLLLLHLSSAPRCAPLHGHQFPSGHIHLLQERSSIAVGGYLLPRDLHELLADRLLSHGLFQRLQGNVCSSSWRTFTPSFFNDLGVCRVVFTDSHSCPSQLQFFWRLFFSPSLNTFPLRCSPLSCALWWVDWSQLEPSVSCMDTRASPHRHSPPPPLRSVPGHPHSAHCLPSFSLNKQ